MEKREIEMLNFLYNRLIKVHKENPDTDYMLKLHDILSKEINKSITIQKRSDDYIAYLNNDPKLWGCGSTPNAAIGDVIHTHYKELNVKIILEW